MKPISSFMDHLAKESAGIADLIRKQKKQMHNQPGSPQVGSMQYHEKFQVVSNFVMGIKDILG
jgi:hypothetical protein